MWPFLHGKGNALRPAWRVAGAAPRSARQPAGWALPGGAAAALSVIVGSNMEETGLAGTWAEGGVVLDREARNRTWPSGQPMQRNGRPPVSRMGGHCTHGSRAGRTLTGTRAGAPGKTANVRYCLPVDGAPSGPLRFVPRPRPFVWGGRRLEAVLGRRLPPDTDIGESWDLVDLPGESSVVAPGPFAGRWTGARLSDLVRTRTDAVLGAARPGPDGGFPLLVKLIDAHRMLSVQVHPDASTAAAQGGGARPKDETWFVLHAAAEARLFAGLRPGVGPAELRRALAQASASGAGPDDQGAAELIGLLERHRPRPGDVLLIEAGTVHCLGADVILVEVQQPSDTTWRLHDWGRGRPLHVEQAISAIHWDRPPPRPAPGGAVECSAFSAGWRRGGGDEPPSDRARVLVATSPGSLVCGGVREPLAAGDTVLLPAACPAVAIEAADHVRVVPA